MTFRGLLAGLAATTFLGAAPAPTPPKRSVDSELVVGVYAAPPWAMKAANGEWSGLTVDLWKELARDLGLRYRLVEQSPDAILDAIGRGEMDTAAGPFAVTLEREREVDFTHGYIVSGVSIAVVRMGQGDRWLAVIEALTTPTALRLYAIVVVLVFLAGAALWGLERRRNAMFAGRPLQGIGSGFWWAGVTTVGVGYGDKVPITFWGRLLALFWMFVSLVLITALTAFVTAKLALAEVGQVQGPASLHSAHVGTVEGSAATDLLEREGITARVYLDGASGVAGLLSGEITALVYGSDVLRYYADRDRSRRIQILPGTLEVLTFAFPLADDSPLRPKFNAALRRLLVESHWQDVRERYLGGSGMPDVIP
jgi:polar amino acid transport system substrate-binding protein